MFDPTQGLFTAMDAIPDSVEPVDISTLAPMYRALLVIDGTVTRFLEAYNGEPVDVRRHVQRAFTSDTANPWLGVEADCPLIWRESELVGEDSGRLYVFARTLLVPERLPEDVRLGMEEDHVSIGRVLAAARLETRRELLWYGRAPLVMTDQRNPGLNADCLVREYRILAGDSAVMLIREYFPGAQTG